jgi:hypothetical protein
MIRAADHSHGLGTTRDKNQEEVDRPETKPHIGGRKLPRVGLVAKNGIDWQGLFQGSGARGRCVLWQVKSGRRAKEGDTPGADLIHWVTSLIILLLSWSRYLKVQVLTV